MLTPGGQDTAGVHRETEGFPGGSVVKNLPVNAADTDSILVREDPNMRWGSRALATTTWPARPAAWEPERAAPALQHERGAPTATKTQHSQRKLIS